MSAADQLITQIQEQRFATTRFRAGYDTTEVDDFLDRIVALLQDNSDPRQARRDAAQQVREAAFRTATFQTTYDMMDVDVFLDEVLLPALADAGLEDGDAGQTELGNAQRDPDLEHPEEGPDRGGAVDGPDAPGQYEPSQEWPQGWSESFPSDVDQFEDPLIVHLREARFPAATGRTLNYPTHEVDSLLDGMIAALSAGPDRIGGRREALIVLAGGSLDRSRTPRESYRAEDVDMFLLDVHNRLRGG